MPMKIKVELEGFEKFKKEAERIINIDRDIQKIIKTTTNDIQSNAKAKAKKDTGFLSNSIRTRMENNGFTGIVEVLAKYGAYVEFGTRGQVKIPSGYGDLASMFKGTGGGAPPSSALKGWASRHGLTGKEFLIARAIGKNGTRPQPYLIPSYEISKRFFTIDVDEYFKKLEKEFNGK